MTLLKLLNHDASSFASGAHDIPDEAAWAKAVHYAPDGLANRAACIELWLDPADRTSRCLIDGRLVRAIDKGAGPGQPLTIGLVLPTPVPASPLAYGQDLRIALVRAAFHGTWIQQAASGQWTSATGDPATGVLGAWMDKPYPLHQHPQTRHFHFPMGRGGLAVFDGDDAALPWMPQSRNADLFYTQMGLVRLASTSELVFAFAPRGHADILRGYTAPGLLGDPGLVFTATPHPGSGTTMVQSPLLLMFALAPSTDEPGWTLVTQWRGMRNGTSSKDLDLSPLRFGALVDATWNDTVRRLGAGRHVEHVLSWLPLPLISTVGAGGAFALVGMQRDPSSGPTRATNLAPSGPRPEQLQLDIAALGLSLRGELAAVPLTSWHESLDMEGLPVKSIDRRDLEAAYAARRPESEDRTLLAHWNVKIHTVNPTAAPDAGVVVGSMEIRFAAGSPGPDSAWAECRLRGHWSIDGRDLYPGFVLELPCTIRPSGASDLGTQDRTAQFDTASEAEDALQRESGAIIGRAPAPAWRNATLRLSYTTQPGREAVTEMVLSSPDKDRTLGEEALYLQLRPFFVGRMRPASFVPQAGERIAEWRSNDAEGPQWRLPDATVEVLLPPQAVGEEMERGKRFHPAPGQPSLRGDAPLRYRFAPPTRLVVSPAADRPRRYNTSPYNLVAALRYAKVEEFTTEIAYPVQTAFKVDLAGDPDIRIAETERFIGRPAPNLPPAEGPITRASPLLRRLFEPTLATWVSGLPPAELAPFDQAYAELRRRQSAVRMNFVARLAEHHVIDPRRRDGKLMLREGLRSVLRDTGMGAPPMLSPLPVGVDLDPAGKAAIRPFLDGGIDWATLQSDKGALAAGVLYTVEFASELLALLRTPLAASTVIEHLSFTALGANAHFSVSFDEGRTTFTVDVRHGQVSRLVKTRIGRIALLWNVAKHVVIYQRDVVPSRQFEDEQKDDPKAGWPILRKWEEFIEPVERVRQFGADRQKESNVGGFVEGAEFVTPRIYVNGGWGRDLDADNAMFGYEIPLWNPRDTSGFYPKPTVSLRVHAGDDGVNRLPCRDPEYLFFYSNTEQNGGNNPDLWEAKAGLDGDTRFARIPALTGRSLSQEQRMRPTPLPAPRPGGLHRPRFDLAVLPLATANLQHGRGQEQILTRLEVVSLSRTDSTETPALGDVAAQLSEPLKLVDAASEIAAIEARVRQLLERLPAMALDVHRECGAIKARMRAELDRGFGDLAESLTALPDTVGAHLPAVAEAAVGRLKKALRVELDGLLGAPVRALDGMAQTVRASALDALALTAAELEARRASIVRVLAAHVDAIDGVARQAVDDMDRIARNPLRAAFGQIALAVTAARTGLVSAAAAFEGWSVQQPDLAALMADATARIDLASQALAGARRHLGLALATEPGAVPGLMRPVALVLFAVLRDLDAGLEQTQARLAGVRQVVRDSGTVEALRNFLDKEILQAKRGVLDVLTGFRPHVDAAASALDALEQRLFNEIDGAVQAARGVALALRTTLAGYLDWLSQDPATLPAADLAGKLQALADDLEAKAGPVRRRLAALVQSYLVHLAAPLTAPDGMLDQAFGMLTRVTMEAAARTVQYGKELDIGGRKHELAGWLTDRYAEAGTLIDNLDCDALPALGEALRATIGVALKDVGDKVTRALTNTLDDATRHQFEEIARDAAAGARKLGAGIKLVKAIGELPALPTLSFNAARAEYVFDDFKKQIATSPFATRLKEIGDGLQDLGLTLPSQALLDRFIPDELEHLDFNQVFNKVAGIDFADFFKRFRLPAEFDKDNIKVVHGIDRASRQAWVKTEVKSRFDGETSLLEFGSLAVRMRDILIDAKNDVKIGLDGTREAETHARLKADWALEFSGSRLATFRQVTVSYDGRGFDFDVSPANIELHPSLKFVSEFAKRFGESLPPAIELERDGRGIPVGARTSIVTVISDLPPLGPVTIGPLRIAAGLGLRVSQKGTFIVSTHIAVGSRAAPVFVQIGYLGGGMWLEARAEMDGGHVRYSASVGLALGSLRALNFAGIARGHYAILLFANIEVADAGGTLRAGLSFEGAARILGMCNASLSILLEAVHGSGGGTVGHGELHVEVEICWCYTLRVHRSVTQSI